MRFVAMILAAGCSTPAGAGAPVDVEARAQELMRDPDPVSWIGRWKGQLDAGCTERSWASWDQPWPPQYARLVRNTAYALRGRTFDSPDLAALFAREPWYAPRPDAPLPPPAEVACAERMAAWEQRQRQAHPIPKELEERLVREGFFERFLRDPDAHVLWPRSGQPFEFGGDTWWCERREPATPEYPCMGAALYCPKGGACGLGSGP